MRLVHDSRISIETLIERMTIGPVRALGLDRFAKGIGTLEAGGPADFVLLDPKAEWTVDPASFASKGKNTPLADVTLKGGVVATYVAGKRVNRVEAAVG
jgi:dihydroorotase